MKLYGYTEEELEKDEPRPLHLTEITIGSNPDELRKIAKFLNDKADDIEELKDGFEHEHICDADSSFEGEPHIIVWNDASL